MTFQKHPRTYALTVSVIVSFVVAYVSSAINVALPYIGQSFTLDSVFLGWIASAYLLFSAILLIPFGKLADMYGKKLIIKYGTIIFTIAILLSALSNSGMMLLISRIMVAVGSAMIIGNVYSLIASAYPDGEEGKPLAISVAAAYVGLSVGPVLGGFLTQFFGWRSIFLFAIPIALMVLFFIFKLKGEWFEKDVGGINIKVISIFALSLISLMGGLSSITTISGIMATICGFLGVALFIWLQKKVFNPLIHPKLLFNRIFIINNLTSLVNYGPGIFSIFLLSLYLQNFRGLSPEKAGLLLCVQPVFIAISSVLVGKIRDFARPRYIAATGMALTAIGLTFFIFLDIYTSFMFIIIGLGIIGFGYGLSAASSTEISLRYVEKRFYGVSSASLNTMRLVGQMLGMGVTIAALSLFMGNAPLRPENTSSFIGSCRISFFIYALLCYISIYGYFIIRKEKNKDQKL